MHWRVNKKYKKQNIAQFATNYLPVLGSAISF